MRTTIGYLATDIQEEIPFAMWQGIAAAAREQDANIIFFAGGAIDDPFLYRRLANTLYELASPQRLDGIIIATSSIGFSTRTEVLEAFLRSFAPLPVVSIEQEFDGIPTVTKDNYTAMCHLMEHLLRQHNRRKILFLQGPAGAYLARRQFDAYRDTLLRFGIPTDPRLVSPHPEGWSYEEGVRQVRALLAARSLHPGVDFDAVAAINDENALAAITVLREQGARIPEDVSVVGFDDLAISAASAIPLTTVRCPSYTLGYEAAQRLFALLAGNAPAAPVMVPEPLVIRQSCGCQLPTVTRVAQTDAPPPAGSDFEAVLQAALAEELRGSSGAFLAAASQQLESLPAGTTEHWQDRLSAARAAALAALPQARHPQVETLYQQARVLMSEAVWRAQARQALHTARLGRSLRQLGLRLAAMLDFRALIETLARELPRLGITRCYLALYEHTGRADAGARMVMAYDERGTAILPPEEHRYPAPLLVPPTLWDSNQRYALLAQSLHFRGEPLGFALFETTGLAADDVPVIVDALQMQISSSIKVALLHNETQAARREAEAGWQLAEERRRAAEEANKLKSTFLSMVSHELRAPLNLIAGLSENLLQDSQRPAQPNPRHLERIHASAQHLDSLIRDVLDLASSHVGQLKLVLERIEVAETLRPVLDLGEAMAREKGLDWHAEVPPDLPPILYDRTRLRQVALNLISNAVKFTEHGAITVRAARENDGVILSITDTGIGIPVEDQAIIFEEFRQSRRSSARGHGGLGLGLAICRKLVELGGGQIHAASSGDSQSGSRFWFWLPAITTSVEAPLLANRRQVVAILTKQPGSAAPLLARLQAKGYAVEEIAVETQGNWLQNLLAAPPGAVVLDFEPASEQGWEIVGALKQSPATSSLPVLFYALFLEADKGTLLEADYLEKPLLGTRLAAALEGHGIGGSEAEQKQILIVDDEPGILEHHTRMVQAQFPRAQIHAARNGREALERMRETRPDLVLLDLMMPEMDGFQVLEAMREKEATRAIPVIVLTSRSLAESEMQLLNQGVSAVLRQGMFSAEETLAQVEAVLARNKRLGSEARRIARRAMAYIHDHFHEPINRKDLAVYIGVSPEYLSTCFSRETGISPMTYLERYRIQQARCLLETTARTIAEVAEAVGFNDPSYFGRVFHRETGLSPNAYRREKNA